MFAVEFSASTLYVFFSLVLLFVLGSNLNFFSRKAYTREEEIENNIGLFNT